jgi:DNA-binding response OmpR family regulator
VAGYATELASNGAEALDHLRRHNLDLCIVDINMPTMDGFEFLAKLREHDTKTPVLMLSARDSPVDVAKGLRFGADDYVRKPFSLEEILLRISAILRRSNVESADDLVLTSGPTRSVSMTSRSRYRRPSSDCSKCFSSERTAW